MISLFKMGYFDGSRLIYIPAPSITCSFAYRLGLKLGKRKFN